MYIVCERAERARKNFAFMHSKLAISYIIFVCTSDISRYNMAFNREILGGMIIHAIPPPKIWGGGGGINPPHPPGIDTHDPLDPLMILWICFVIIASLFRCAYSFHPHLSLFTSLHNHQDLILPSSPTYSSLVSLLNWTFTFQLVLLIMYFKYLNEHLCVVLPLKLRWLEINNNQIYT